MYDLTLTAGLAVAVVCCLSGGGCSLARDVNSPRWHAAMLEAGELGDTCAECGDTAHWDGICGDVGSPSASTSLNIKELRDRRKIELLDILRTDWRDSLKAGDVGESDVEIVADVFAGDPFLLSKDQLLLWASIPHHLRELIRLRSHGGQEALVDLLMSDKPTPFWVSAGKQWSPWRGLMDFSCGPQYRVMVGDLADFALQEIHDASVGWQIGQARTEREEGLRRWRNVLRTGEFPKVPLSPDGSAFGSGVDFSVLTGTDFKALTDAP